MVSDLRTFAYKRCEIAAIFFFFSSANFALLTGFFWYRCYYLHRSRDSLSPICRIFTTEMLNITECVRIKKLGIYNFHTQNKSFRLNPHCFCHYPYPPSPIPQTNTINFRYVLHRIRPSLPPNKSALSATLFQPYTAY